MLHYTRGGPHPQQLSLTQVDSTQGFESDKFQVFFINGYPRPGPKEGPLYMVTSVGLFPEHYQDQMCVNSLD